MAWRPCWLTNLTKSSVNQHGRHAIVFWISRPGIGCKPPISINVVLFQVNQSPSASLNLSYGFEFDAAGLSEVDKIEQHFLHDPSIQSPVAPSKDGMKGHTTPQMPGQAFTPHFSSDKRNGAVMNKFGCGRERISTPIEDSEHVALFSSTHSPVFSPVGGVFRKFENSNDRSHAMRRSFETHAGNTSKRCLVTKLLQLS